MLKKSKSSNQRLAGDWLERIGTAHRLRSFYERMKRVLKNHQPAFLDEPIFFPGDDRWKEKFVGYLTGKTLVDLGVINSKQLAEALKRQRESQERGKRISLGVLSVEMRYTTSKEYLDALSRYFRLPTLSLLKLIPSPKVQALFADRYVHYNRLHILQDYGSELSRALSEPDPLILEELQKTLKIRLLPFAQGSDLAGGNPGDFHSSKGPSAGRGIQSTDEQGSEQSSGGENGRTNQRIWR